MTTNLTFLVITSRQDSSIIETLESIKNVGKILIIDGGNRKFQDSEHEVNLDLRKIAKLFGAEYFYLPYKYSAQSYNFAISRVSSGYIFILDSDETIDHTLRDWLMEDKFLENPVYGIRRENIFCGRPIKHGHLGPDFPIRLFQHGAAQYEDRSVHAHLIFSGKAYSAKGKIMHNSNPTVEHFALKILAFTNREESARNCSELSRNERFVVRRNLKHLKLLGFLRFSHSYVLKKGFLEGRLGFQLAMAAWFYEILVSLRMRNNENR